MLYIQKTHTVEAWREDMNSAIASLARWMIYCGYYPPSHCYKLNNR